MLVFDNDKKNEEIINDLLYAWSMDCTDVQACYYAKIDLKKLNQLFNEYPNLTNEKNVVKNKQSFLAVKNISESLQKGNLETSKWYAERKMKNEFSTKIITEQDSSNIDEKMRQVEKFMEEFSTKNIKK